jgi:LmbE family N-acetylglucosaminyl deacetylase
VLAVLAHPDDESFGLGVVIDGLAAAGAAVHIMRWLIPPAAAITSTTAR